MVGTLEAQQETEAADGNSLKLGFETSKLISKGTLCYAIFRKVVPLVHRFSNLPGSV